MKRMISRADALACIGILIVTTAFFFKLFYPAPQLIVTPDFGEIDALSSYSTKVLYAQGLQAKSIPLWTSRLGGGYPIFANGLMSALYIPNIIFFYFFHTVLAYNLSIVLSILLIGWGMYLWFRLESFEPVVAFLGSTTVALSGYIITQLTHISLIQALSLSPLMFSFTYIVAKGKKWKHVGMLSILLSQQITVGHPQSVFITVFFAAFYFIWLIRKDKDAIKSLIQSVIGLALGGGLAAAQLLPSIEYNSKLTSAQGFQAGQATFYSFPLKQIATLIQPYLLGNPKFGTYPDFVTLPGSIFWENTIYIGAIPLLLLCIWISIYFKKLIQKKQFQKTPANTSFYLGMVAISLLLMLGNNSPIYLIHSIWPFAMFRVPSRFAWIFVVSLTFLAIYALQEVSKTIRSTFWKYVFLAAVISIQLVTLKNAWFDYHANVPADSWLKTPALARLVPQNENVYSLGTENLHNKTFLKHGWMSTSDYYYERNSLTPDKSMLWDIDNFRDYAGRTLARPDVIRSAVEGEISMNDTTATISAVGTKLLSLYNVKALLSAVPINASSMHEISQYVFNTKKIIAYNNVEALPRVYIATDIRSAQTAEEGVAILKSDAFVLGSSVLRENAAEYALKPTTPYSVNVQKIGMDTFKVTVKNSPDKAVLVLSQTYFPGWNATIDGKKAGVFPANIRSIGVTLPQGDHTVVFNYHPRSLDIGIIISIISILITACLVGFAYFFDR